MEALYRKYRPKIFSELVGQGNIIKTLTNAIKHERIGQAYLFTGPRGTGKTTIARLFAKSANCLKRKGEEACQTCTSCRTIQENKSFDVIEIDAASHTGVDNIRQLRETVSLPPTVSKYKVYIIDEVHMLSTGAFNALLKTLEEPPAHVIFILATTEIHKVPDTIISRCQRFDFSRLPFGDIIEKLKKIAKSEKVSINDESLEMIAIASEGGMRDAESLFSQIIALEDKKITAKEVEEIIGTTDRKTVSQIASLIVQKDSTEAISLLNKLVEDGHDVEVFTKSLINYFRQLMLVKVNSKLMNTFSYELTKEQQKEMQKLADEADLSIVVKTIELLVKAKGEISTSVFPQLPLEIVVVISTGKLPQPGQIENKNNKNDKDNNNIPSEKENLTTEKPNAEPQKPAAAQKIEKEEPQINIPKNGDAKPVSLDEVEEKWSLFLEKIKEYNRSLHSLLRMHKPSETEGNNIIIQVRFDFHKRKFEAHKLTMEETFANILKFPVKFSFILDESQATKPKRADYYDDPEEDESAEAPSLLDDAMKIMGGKIVEG